MGFGERGCTISTLRPELLHALRLIVLTDRGLAAPRAMEAVVEKALLGGAPAIQLREKETSAGELLEVGQRLRKLTRRYGALLFVNDRLDVALADETSVGVSGYVGDSADKIDYDRMARIGRLIFGTAWELANRDERPAVSGVGFN